MQYRNLLVSLEGNIGSGKSTLLAQLQAGIGLSIDDLKIVPEPVEVWTERRVGLSGSSMLQCYYENQNLSFAFQMYVLKTRLDQVLEVPSGCRILSERSLSSHDAIFACGARARGNINDVEWVTYRGWVESVNKMCGENQPHGVVYLRTSASICARRRETRDRGAENGLPASLFDELHDAHEEYIKDLRHHGVPVHVINGDIDQWSMTEVDRQNTVRDVIEFINGLTRPSQ